MCLETTPESFDCRSTIAALVEEAVGAVAALQDKHHQTKEQRKTTPTKLIRFLPATRIASTHQPPKPGPFAGSNRRRRLSGWRRRRNRTTRRVKIFRARSLGPLDTKGVRVLT